MFTNNIIINNDQQERARYSDTEFPLVNMYGNLADYPGGHAPWHWHRDIELLYVTNGEITVSINDSSVYRVYGGNGIIVNSGVMHMMEPGKDGKGLFICQLFDPEVLKSDSDGIIEDKYINPILRSEKVKVYELHQTNPAHVRIMKRICEISDLAEERNECYELEIRNRLSEIWIELYKALKAEINSGTSSRKSQKELWLRQMMSYMHKNYGNKLTLKDISAAAGISERECCRCFSDCMRTTPMGYLQDYRISRACEMLKNTRLPMYDIAETCGYIDGSYFAKQFKETMGITPGQYRKNSLQENKT